MTEAEKLLLAKLEGLQEELAGIRAELFALRGETIRETYRVRPYTVKEFAALIGRHPEFVSERCKVGVIKTTPGKPYRIPVSEVNKWVGAGSGRSDGADLGRCA
jgi:hypothetical protein